MISVSFEGDKAFFTIPNCDIDTLSPHQVSISSDGRISTQHHTERYDDIVEALGGVPNQCRKTVLSWRAADKVAKILSGKEEIPLLTNKNSFQDEYICPEGCEASLEHFATLGHNASKLGADLELSKSLLKWLQRINGYKFFIDKELPYSKEEATIAIGNYRQALTLSMVESLYDNYISLEYLKKASTISSMNSLQERISDIVELRLSGMTIEWLDRFILALEPKGYKTLREPRVFPRLFLAKVVAPEDIAKYLNSGINSYFYTYAQYQADPIDILKIYHGTNRQRTLYSYLKEGKSISRAKLEAGVV
jgi:hypothetical protein